jgi:hypothetical protein
MSSTDDYAREPAKLLDNLNLPGSADSCDEEIVDVLAQAFLGREVKDSAFVERYALRQLNQWRVRGDRAERLAARVRQRVIWAGYRSGRTQD